jgi:hypothetical protein
MLNIDASGRRRALRRCGWEQLDGDAPQHTALYVLSRCGVSNAYRAASLLLERLCNRSREADAYGRTLRLDIDHDRARLSAGESEHGDLRTLQLEWLRPGTLGHRGCGRL